MSHADKELSRREYRREIRQRAWARTVERAWPWFRRLYEQVVRTLLLALLLLFGLVGGGRALFGEDVFSWETVFQALWLAAAIAAVAGVRLGVGFLWQLFFVAPYELYREVRSEAGKWLAKLNSTIKENQQLTHENERLKTGRDMAGLIRNLLDEIERNKKLGGKLAGRPERLYLNTVIEEFERRGVRGPLAKSLYDLRQCIAGQESLAQYPPSTISSQFKSHCLPALEEAEKEIKRFLAELESTGQEKEGDQ